jgi:hypothetical protein
MARPISASVAVEFSLCTAHSSATATCAYMAPVAAQYSVMQRAQRIATQCCALQQSTNARQATAPYAQTRTSGIEPKSRCRCGWGGPTLPPWCACRPPSCANALSALAHACTAVVGH